MPTSTYNIFAHISLLQEIGNCTIKPLSKDYGAGDIYIGRIILNPILHSSTDSTMIRHYGAGDIYIGRIIFNPILHS